MRFRPLSSNLYSKNRDLFMQAMKSGGLAIFNSNDIYPISADSTLPFAQHRDIFYLCGINQEESILLLFPNAPKPEHREILFLTPPFIHTSTCLPVGNRRIILLFQKVTFLVKEYYFQEHLLK